MVALSDTHELSKRWFPIEKEHPEFIRLMQSTARFDVIAAGRRSFKSELMKRRGVLRCLSHPRPDARFGFCAPTHPQAKAIFWNDLKQLIPDWALKGEPHESDRRIDIHPQKEIRVFGLEKAQRLEGVIWDELNIDEIEDCKPDMWEAHIVPALDNHDRPGRANVWGVPEGKRLLYKLWTLGKEGDPEYASYYWKSSEVLPAEIIEKRRAQMDPVIFRREYEASFEEFSDLAYYNFDRRKHCEANGRPVSLTYSPVEPLEFCFDFNRKPGVAAVCQLQPRELYDDAGVSLPETVSDTFDAFIGEVHIDYDSTTPKVCRKLCEDWGHHQGWVDIYGDATGGAGGSAKVEGSDWALVEKYLRPTFGDRLRMRVPEANPREKLRVNAMNSRLMTADEVTHVVVDPVKCRHLALDFEGVGTIPGSAGEIDKKTNENLTHLTDAVSYRAFARYPEGSGYGVRREAI